jgi:hypothetical protein
MSLKDIDVMPKKNPTDVVHWNEYEALHDHLQRQILNAKNPLYEVSRMWSWASKMPPMKPSMRHNDKLLKFNELSLLCSKL